MSNNTDLLANEMSKLNVSDQQTYVGDNICNNGSETITCQINNAPINEISQRFNDNGNENRLLQEIDKLNLEITSLKKVVDVMEKRDETLNTDIDVCKHEIVGLKKNMESAIEIAVKKFRNEEIQTLDVGKKNNEMNKFREDNAALNALLKTNDDIKEKFELLKNWTNENLTLIKNNVLICRETISKEDIDPLNQKLERILQNGASMDSRLNVIETALRDLRVNQTKKANLENKKTEDLEKKCKLEEITNHLSALDINIVKINDTEIISLKNLISNLQDSVKKCEDSEKKQISDLKINLGLVMTELYTKISELGNTNKATDLRVTNIDNASRQTTKTLMQKISNIETNIASYQGVDRMARENSERLDQVNVNVEANFEFLSESIEGLRNEAGRHVFREANILSRLGRINNKIGFDQGVVFWQINNFRLRFNSKPFCPSFYTDNGNGYRLQLQLTANNIGDGLLVLVRLLKGRNDTDLEWPFRKTVTIRLLDLEHRGRHFCRKVPYENTFNRTYQQPSNAIGLTRFISYNELCDSKKYLLVNDRMIVDCFVDEFDE